MGKSQDKGGGKPNAKKEAKLSLKEKRAAKKEKQAAKI